MAITYHAGRRIQGISRTERQAGSGLTFSDDFSSDKGWETSNSTYMDYDSGNSRLKTHWYGGGAGANKTVVYDLGEGMVSDTKWILRMKINFGSTDGADNEGFIGLSDSDETAGRETAQDFLGVCFLAGYSTTAWNGFYECEADGVILPPTAGNNAAYNFSDSTDYWLEIKRTSATGLTYTVYSDAFSTSLATQSVTVASTVSGLRYIKFANYPTASTDQPGAYVDDVQFYNDVTSTSTTPVAEVPASGDIKPTNVQLGSRFEETDTRKMYNLIDDPTIEDDFSSSAGWTQVTNTASGVSGGELIGLTNSSGTNGAGAWKDYGLVSDTKFVLRCKFQIVIQSGQSGNASTLYFGISDTNGATSPFSNRDGFGIAITNYALSGMLWLYPDGTTWDNSDTDMSLAPTATTYYLEIARTSATSVTFKLFSDEYSTVVKTHTQTIASTLNGLRYVMFQEWRNGSNNTTKVAVDDLKIYNDTSSVSSFTPYWQEIGA